MATIPSAIKVKGLNAPQQDGSYKWIENPRNDTTKRMYPIPDFRIKFLEYPMDMEFVKVALDYDKTVRGVLSIMNYDIENGESQKTTINQMFKGMKDADETGYRGIAMHDPLETQQNLGFMSNRTVAGNKSLDTLYLMNMMLPVGEFSVDLYATDDAYIDYMEKVKQSVSDSRFIPESNIENGMGVFSGMTRTRVTIGVNGDGVSFSHIAQSNCGDTEGDLSDSWDSRGCRLYQDIACSGAASELISESTNWWSSNDKSLIAANERAFEIYRDSVYNRNHKSCYASNVKAAMMLDTTKWSLFLPDTINAEDKASAYADGLKRYCVASNFESNHIADCSALEEECLEGTGVVASSDFSSKIYVRGGASDQNLFLFDNAVVYSPVHFFGLFSTFLVEGIEDVQFYKSGFPAQYGNRLSSVLKMDGRAGGQDSVEEWFSKSSVKISTFAAQLHTEGHKGPARWVLAGRTTYIGYVLDLCNAIGLLDLDLDYEFTDLQGTFMYDFSKDTRLKFSYYIGKDKLEFDPLYMDWGNIAIPLGIYHRINNDWDYNATFAYSKFYQTMKISDLMSIEMLLHSFAGKQWLNYRGIDNHTVTLGYELEYVYERYEEKMASISVADIEKTFHHVAYVQDAWKVSPDFLLQCGLRFNYQTEFQERRCGTDGASRRNRWQ